MLQLNTHNKQVYATFPFYPTTLSSTQSIGLNISRNVGRLAGLVCEGSRARRGYRKVTCTKIQESNGHWPAGSKNPSKSRTVPFQNEHTTTGSTVHVSHDYLLLVVLPVVVVLRVLYIVLQYGGDVDVELLVEP
jgi:hypothetical protein